MRWADMDLLGHVNNVTYLEYVAEAREDLFQGTGVDREGGDRPPGRVRLAAGVPAAARCWSTPGSPTSVRPASRSPTRCTTPRRSRVASAPSTCAPRASLATSLSPTGARRRRGLDRPGPRGARLAGRRAVGRRRYALTVRRADVDEHGLARDVAFFEYLQEARIQFLMDLHTRGQRLEPPRRRAHRHRLPGARALPPGALRRPLVDRPRGHAVVHDPGGGARRRHACSPGPAVVMVTFDMETQRPTDMAESQRARLLQELGG